MDFFESIRFSACGLIPLQEFGDFCYADEDIAIDGVEYESDVDGLADDLNDMEVSKTTGTMDLNWLIVRASTYIESSESLLSPYQLGEEVIKVVCASCKTANGEEYLQSKLFELIGESGFEFMVEIMQNIDRISSFRIDDLKRAQQLSSTLPRIPANETLNQRKKREKREEKEKLAAVGPSSITSDPSLDWLKTAGFSEDYLEQERMLGLQGGSAPGSGSVDAWTINLAPSGTREYYEQRGLPAGTKKSVTPGFEEVDMPAAQKLDAPPPGGLVEIELLESWAQLAFPGTQRLNRIQSAVFDTAYGSSENMLVCAPTGAGKTNIAMLAFLQLLKQKISEGRLDKASVKAVYIAPMKALAQEVVAKFSER